MDPVMAREFGLIDEVVTERPRADAVKAAEDKPGAA
jgi:hypothetical protein